MAKLPMRRIINPVLNTETHKHIQHEAVLLRAHERLLRKGRGYREALEKMRKRRLLSQAEYALEIKKLEGKLEFLLSAKIRQMKRLSERDPGLSHLYNKKQMQRLLQEWFERRDKKPFSVIMFDLDHFKRVNDTFGHGVGDKVLAFFSARLNELIRKRNGLAGRFGGEEFVGVLPIVPKDAAGFLRGLRKRLMVDFDMELGNTTGDAFFKQLGKMITFSAGIAGSGEGRNWIEVVGKADKLVYVSKDGGRDRVSYHGESGVVQWPLG